MLYHRDVSLLIFGRWPHCRVPGGCRRCRNRCCCRRRRRSLATRRPAVASRSRPIFFLFFTTTPSRDPFLSLKNRVSFRFSDSCSHNQIIVFGSTHTFGSPCRNGNNENGVFRARRRRTTDIRDACPSTLNRYVPLNVLWYLQCDTIFTHANDRHCRHMFRAECPPTCIVVWAVFPDRLWLTLHEVIDYLPPFARLQIPRPFCWTTRK